MLKKCFNLPFYDNKEFLFNAPELQILLCSQILTTKKGKVCKYGDSEIVQKLLLSEKENI